MIAGPTLLLLAAQTGSATLSVGATVVRPEPEPAVAVERGAIVVRNAAAVAVTAERASVRRDGGTVTIVPRRAGGVTVTLTY